jgi:hypothetical protein
MKFVSKKKAVVNDILKTTAGLRNLVLRKIGWFSIGQFSS